MSVAARLHTLSGGKAAQEGPSRGADGLGRSRRTRSDLTSLQVDLFHRQGYLWLPEVFALEEMGWLCNEARILSLSPSAFACACPEKDGPAAAPARGIDEVHLREPGFRNLARHPRLLRPARRLLGGSIWLAGTHLWPVPGAPLDDRWQPSGRDRRTPDRLGRCGALLAVVFLDDGPDQGGRIWLLPGSHRRDDAGIGPAAGDHGRAGGGALPIIAMRGSVLFIHSDLLCRLDDVAQRRTPPMFFARLHAVPNAADGRPPPAGSDRCVGATIEAGDDCLWPPPYCVAG